MSAAGKIRGSKRRPTRTRGWPRLVSRWPEEAGPRGAAAHRRQLRRWTAPTTEEGGETVRWVRGRVATVLGCMARAEAAEPEVVASSCLVAAVHSDDSDGAHAVACCRRSWARRCPEAWLGGEAWDEEQGCGR
jgi:hypothetical protein